MIGEIIPANQSGWSEDKIAWKNLQRRSLADAMLIDHDALKELDDVHELIDWSHLESLLLGHLNVDEDELIKATDYTARNVHGSNCFAGLLSGDKSSVYADSAYHKSST